MGMDVFVSVGTGLNSAQEAFVSALEERLRAIGLNPCSIGRNRFSTNAPLHAVSSLMEKCAGAVVIALERYHFAEGVERRGSPKEKPLRNVAFPTSWNQIEASLANQRGLPLLVIVDQQLHCDGLLEKGNDWFVHEVSVQPAALDSPAFIGLLNDWRERLGGPSAARRIAEHSKVDPGSMTIRELAGALKPSQLWAAVVAIAGALAASFALGAKLLG